MVSRLAQNVAAVWIGAITSALIVFAAFVSWLNDGSVAEIPQFVGLGIATGLGSLGGIARGETSPNQPG